MPEPPLPPEMSALLATPPGRLKVVRISTFPGVGNVASASATWSATLPPPSSVAGPSQVTMPTSFLLSPTVVPVTVPVSRSPLSSTVTAKAALMARGLRSLPFDRLSGVPTRN